MRLLKELLKDVTVHQNVSDYSFTIGDNNHWTVINNKQKVTKNPSVYFITEFYDKDCSIGHWVYESLILVRYFQLLKNYIPNLKWHIKVNKSYKTLFLDKYCVSKDDISYNLNLNNLCFFVRPWTLNNNKNFSADFVKDVDFLVGSFDYIELNKPTKLLYINHKNKENYSNNARDYNLDRFIELASPTVLNTDKIKNIEDQCNLVRSADTIIVHAGSAYFLNCLLFAKNSNIIVVDTSLKWQIETFQGLKVIDGLIKSKNKSVHYIEYNSDTSKNLYDYLHT